MVVTSILNLDILDEEGVDLPDAITLHFSWAPATKS
jgi:hypothetical protein